jgi:hypothetical protein
VQRRDLQHAAPARRLGQPLGGGEGAGTRYRAHHTSDTGAHEHPVRSSSTGHDTTGGGDRMHGWCLVLRCRLPPALQCPRHWASGCGTRHARSRELWRHGCQRCCMAWWGCCAEPRPQPQPRPLPQPQRQPARFPATPPLSLPLFLPLSLPPPQQQPPPRAARPSAPLAPSSPSVGSVAPRPCPCPPPRLRLAPAPPPAAGGPARTALRTLQSDPHLRKSSQSRRSIQIALPRPLRRRRGARWLRRTSAPAPAAASPTHLPGGTYAAG